MADIIQKILDLKINDEGVARALSELAKQNAELSSKVKQLKKDLKDGIINAEQYGKKVAPIAQAQKKNADETKKLSAALQNEWKSQASNIAAIKQYQTALENLTRRYNALTDAEKTSTKGMNMAAQMNELATRIRTSTEALANQTDKLQSSATSINGLKAKITELTESYRSMSEVERNSAQGKELLQKINETSNAVRNEQKILNDAANGYIRNAGSINSLRERLQALTKQYDNLSKAEREAGKGQQILLHLKSVRKEIEEAEKATGRFQRNVGNYASALKGFGLKALNIFVGVTTTAQALVKLGDAMKDGIQTFIAFERQVSKLSAILQTTDDNIKTLTAQAKQLGATTRYTATEVAELQVELAKLGYSKGEIMVMSESVLNLAQATGSSLADAASLAGAALRVFGDDATQLTKYVDQMAVATAKSALSFDYIKTALPIVGGAADMFGFDLQDTLALLGQLANSGMEASMAATATRNIFLKLADSSGALSKQLGKPVTNLEELLSGLDTLREKGANLNDALELTNVRAAVAFTRFLNSTKAARELSNAMDYAALSEDDLRKKANDAGISLQELRKQMEICNGTAKDMAEIMEDNLGGEITRLSSAWDDFVISLASSQGILQSVVKKVKELVSYLGDIVRTTKESEGIQVSKATNDYVTSEEFQTKLNSDKEKYDKRVSELKNQGLKERDAMIQAQTEILEEIDRETNDVLTNIAKSDYAFLESERKRYKTFGDMSYEQLLREKKRVQKELKRSNEKIPSYQSPTGTYWGGTNNGVSKAQLQEQEVEINRLLVAYDKWAEAQAKIDAQENRKNAFSNAANQQTNKSGIGIVDEATVKKQRQTELDAYKRYLDAMLALTEDGMNKQLAVINNKYDKEIATIETKLKEEKNLTANAVKYYNDALVLIEKDRERELSLIRQKYSKEKLEQEQKNIEQRLKMAINGSEEEYQAQKELLESKHELNLQELNKSLNLKRADKTKLDNREGIYKDITDQEVAMYYQNIEREVELLENKILNEEENFNFELQQLDENRAKSIADEMVKEVEYTILASDSELEQLKKIANAKDLIYQNLVERGRLAKQSQIDYEMELTEAYNNAYLARKAVADKEYQMRVNTANAIASTFGTISEAIVQCSETSKTAARAAKIVGLAQLYIQQGVAVANAIRAAAESSITPADLAINIAAAVATTIGSTVAAFNSLNSAKFAKGAVNIQGAGTNTSDSINARISQGESVMTAKATRMFGNLLTIMNDVAAQPSVTLPTQYSSYNPAQTSATNEAMANSMREAVSDIQPVVAVTDINEATSRVNQIKVLDTF